MLISHTSLSETWLCYFVYHSFIKKLTTRNELADRSKTEGRVYETVNDCQLFF